MNGLVLGAGGARGMAHIGVLQVLQEENINFDLVVGCSAGALVGALWAAGVDFYRLERLVSYHSFTKRMFDLSVSRDGFIKGEKILETLRLFTKDMTFEDLKIPFAVIATDIETGELVVLNRGSVAHAVRASISIPGVFRPYRYQDRLLVDGAVKSRLPVNVAKQMGADRVLGVDVPKKMTSKLTTAIDILQQSIEILEEEVFRYQCQECDLIIQPEVGHIGSLQFESAAEAIRLGREAALAKSSEIRRIFA